MNQVIDEIERTSSIKRTFSRLSFSISIITIFLIIYTLTLIPTEMAVQDVFKPLPTELIYANFAIMLFNVIGVIMGIISFIKKEPTTIIKWIGGVFNLGVFIFYIDRLFLHMIW